MPFSGAGGLSNRPIPFLSWFHAGVNDAWDIRYFALESLSERTTLQGRRGKLGRVRDALNYAVLDFLFDNMKVRSMKLFPRAYASGIDSSRDGFQTPDHSVMWA